MKKACFLMFIYVFILTIASIPDALCYPPAGSDHLPSTTATIELEIIGMFTEIIIVNGPTTVSRSTPYDPGDGRWMIDTEIVSMNLIGTSMYIGPIVVVESPSRASTGAIQQLSPGVDFPASSYFNVFVEIHTTFGTFHNDDPALMSTTIDDVPPWGAVYTGPPTPIPLKNATGTEIGFIRHVYHEIGPPPVGGFSVPIGDILVPVDKFGLLTVCIGLSSTVLGATVATAIYVKRVKRREEKQ